MIFFENNNSTKSKADKQSIHNITGKIAVSFYEFNYFFRGEYVGIKVGYKRC